MPVTNIRGQQILNGTVQYVDIQQVVALRLVGNPTGSAATMSEISLGTGLSFSGSSVVLSANLQSLSGLSYSSASFVKMTAAGTFALDTNTYLTAETDTLATVTGRGATTSTAVTFNANVTLGNSADLVFVDLAGTFPTSGKGFDWTLNNDGARIYAIQPGSDSIDLVFQLRDNATTNDRFVFWVDDYQGPAFDKYPLIIRGGTEFDLVSSALYTNGTLRLSNAGVLQNVSGNISMFTNDSGYAIINGTGFVKASGTTISYDNSTYQVTSEKGVANGYASLNSSGQVPAGQLPSYVDDVLEFANLAGFPGTGETGKIYVAIDTNKTYRWSGSAYVEISASPGSTDAVTEGSTNLYFTNARARAAISLTVSGSSGAATYNNSTGVFNIPTYTLAGLGGEPTIAAGTTAQYWRGDKSWQTLNTTAVTEGTNLYYTDARARAALSFTAGSGAYNSSTGVITIPTNTNQLTNGANFITAAQTYYIGTTQNALNRSSAAQTLTGVSIDGNAGSANYAYKIYFDDGPRDLSNRLPNSFTRQVLWDFVTAATAGGTGNYAGVMTFMPWQGTTASTGDSSYQLAFINESSVNGAGLPGLRLRKGIDTTWGSWYTLIHAGNYNSYSPTLTGTGASGTWGISITGNADTVDGLHASAFVRTYGTTSDNIDSDYGECFITFDPIPTGTPPMQSPNLRTINVGANFARRTQLAFDYATDRGFFRRKYDTSWSPWVEFVHSGNISSFEADTLASVTSRGASTSTAVTLSSGSNSFNGHHYFFAYDANGNHYPHYNVGSNNNGAKVNLRVYSGNGSSLKLFYLDGNSGGFTWDGNTVWHSGNDGSTSGLDADLLDGNHASAFALVGHTHDLVRYSLAAPGLIDGLASSNFRSTLFGSSTSGYQISTSRWNNTPTGISGMNNYGTMMAWAGSDTHGFIALDYNTANAQIGGGSGDSISWKATLLHSSNYNSYSPTLTGGGASGTWGISISGNAATATDAGSVDGIDSSRIVYGDGSRGKSTSKTNANANTSDSSNPSGFFFGNNTTGMPSTDWWNWINVAGDSWSGTDGYGYQLANSFWSDDLRFRRLQSGTWYSWISILTSGNYNSYAPTLTGGGASGTWGINVTGNSNNITQYTINQSLGTGNSPTFANLYLKNSSSVVQAPYQSDHDFPTGAYIQTDIAVGSGQPWTCEITAFNYGDGRPTKITINGYNYGPGTYYNGYAISTGKVISGMSVFQNAAGYLCLYIPSQGYWNAYNVIWYVNYNTNSSNRVTSITNAAKPGGISYENAISPTFTLDAANYNSYAPTLTGTGASGTWGISISGNAATATYASSAGYATFLPTAYTSGVQTNPQVYFNNGIGLRVAMTGAWATWSDTLWINGYGGSDVPNMCALHTLRDGTPRIAISTQERQATSYGTIYQFLTEYNWTSYAPTKTGGGASGTWSINVSGTAASETLATVTSRGNSTTSDIYLNNASPTLYFQDTDQRSAMIHVNSNVFYVLRGVGTNSTGWATYNGYWPMELNLENNNATFGGTLTVISNISGNEIYNSGWYRNSVINTGLYSSYSTMHLSSKDNGFWDVSSTTTNSSIRFWTGSHMGALRGYVYANNSNELGFLDTAGSWIIRTVGTANTYLTGTFTASGDVIAYSDARIKTNIQTIYNALEKVMSMRGVTYNRTDVDDKSEKVGVIAQEMEEVLPQVVTKDDTGMLGVSYGNITSVLIEAIKEQQAQIEQLKKQIEFLAENK